MKQSTLGLILISLLSVQPYACVYSNRKLLQGDGLSVAKINEFISYPTTQTQASFVVSIQAPQGRNGDRAPVSVTAVLDRSGSMRGSKIDLLKGSTEFLVETLQGQDSLGIVTYSSDVREDGVLARVTPAVKASLRDTLNRIQALGSTNLSGGLFRGINQQINADVGTSNVKSVILFTDGLPTAGIRSAKKLVSQLRRTLGGQFPPAIYTLGFGQDHDADFLMQIADAGKGQYVFVPDETKIAPVFGEILGGLLTVTAQNIQVELTPLSGASITSVKAGGIVVPSFGSWTINFADLFADERRDILVNLSVPGSAPAVSQQVLRVDVSFNDPKSNSRIIKPSTFLTIERSLSPQSTAVVPNEVVEVTRLRFAVAEGIKAAVDQRRGGDSAGAIQTIDSILGQIYASTANSNGEVQTLKADVKGVRLQLSSPQGLSRTAAGQISANAASLNTQRAVVSGGGSFASNAAGTTSAKLGVAADASQFVGSRAQPPPPASTPLPVAQTGAQPPLTVGVGLPTTFASFPQNSFQSNNFGG